MKKLFFTGALMLLVACAFSQSIIPKAGVTLSKWGGDDLEDIKFNVGFTVGVGFNFPLGTGPISLQPELNFIQKGWKAEDGDATAKAKLNYLEIPILVKATFGEATKFYLNAGPSIGLGFGGKLKAEEGSLSEEVDVKFGDGDDEDALYIEKRTDVGLQLGGGVIVAEKVMIDLRYGLGLTSLFEDATIKNNVLQFTIGIPLGLK